MLLLRGVRTLLERFNVSIEEHTGTVDGRDYAGIVYGAMTDDGYGVGTPFKSSKIGRDVVIGLYRNTTRNRNAN